MSRSSRAALVLLGVGAALLIASFVWPRLSDPQAQWSEQEARDRAEAGMAFHEAVHEMGHARDAAQRREIARQLAAAQERAQAADDRLEDARRRYSRPIAWLRWSGIACLALGSLVYGALRARAA